MRKLLDKLNYKGQNRIAVINAGESFYIQLSDEFRDIQVDQEIDPRFPYDFIILFAEKVSEVDYMAPVAVHNLLADGILWFCYPKKSPEKPKPEIDRERGWKIMINSGFQAVKMVNIDDKWSGIRFRNIKFIKSIPRKYSHQS